MMGTFQLSSFLGYFFREDSWPTNHGHVGHEKKMDLQDFVMLPNRWKNISQTAHLVSRDRNFIRKTLVSKILGFKLWVPVLL